MSPIDCFDSVVSTLCIWIDIVIGHTPKLGKTQLFMVKSQIPPAFVILNPSFFRCEGHHDAIIPQDQAATGLVEFED